MVFFVIISSRIVGMYEENNREIGEDISRLVNNEIKLAKASENGYYRKFKLPQKLNGNDYIINITQNRELVVDFMGFEHVTYLPEKVCGDTFIGTENVLIKEKGWLSINSYWTTTQCKSMQIIGLCDTIEETFPGTICWCCNVTGNCCPT
jgi:hypothetical protein